jgi:hypothetical protein
MPADAKPTHLWSGDCRLGLADGPGYLTYVGPLEMVNRTPSRAVAYMGWYLLVPKRSFASIAKSGAQEFEETLMLWDFTMPSQVDRTTLPVDHLWAANARNTLQLVASFKKQGGADTLNFSRRFIINKSPCPTHDVQVGARRFRIDIWGDLHKGSAQDRRLFDYCQREVIAVLGPKRIREGGPKFDFSKLNRGYYFSVSTETTTRVPSGVLSGDKTDNDWRLCPGLTDPVSCEPLITEMLAPFEADYVRMEQLAVDHNVRTMAARRAFYAPYLAEWRSRVRATATRLRGRQ